MATRVTLSPTDVKDQSRIIQEVENFANVLFSTTSLSDDQEGTDPEDDVVLTFSRESGFNLALTLHQLLSIVKSSSGN